jgi:hypothetical protein
MSIADARRCTQIKPYWTESYADFLLRTANCQLGTSHQRADLISRGDAEMQRLGGQTTGDSRPEAVAEPVLLRTGKWEL